MAKWFKRRGSRKNEQTMNLQGVTATASRALYTGPNELPRIEFTFTVSHGKDEKAGEEFDTITVEMDLYAAAKFIQAANTAYQAAAPPVPGFARRTQFGE